MDLHVQQVVYSIERTSCLGQYGLFHLHAMKLTDSLKMLKVPRLTTFPWKHLQCVQNCVYRPLLAHEVYAPGAVGQLREDTQTVLLNVFVAEELWTENTS